MIDRQENVERLERVALYEQERLRARVIAAEEKFERQQPWRSSSSGRARVDQRRRRAPPRAEGRARHLRVGAADAARRRRHRAAGAAGAGVRADAAASSAAERREAAAHRRPRAAAGATFAARLTADRRCRGSARRVYWRLCAMASAVSAPHKHQSFFLAAD